MSYRKQMKRALLATVATATFAAAVPAISSTTAYAQDYTTGILRGTVQDTTGAVIAGATVEISSNKGVHRSSVTGSDGTVRMPRLPVGAYTITISHEGHETLSDQTVAIGLGDGAPVTFTMAIPGSEVDEIVVSGTAVSSWDFNSTTTGISVNVGELFEKTPIARDVTAIALLAPGSAQGDSAFGKLASIGGSSVAENVYYVNGLNVTNFRNFTGGSTIPFEFYETMDVKTGGFQAEYGRSTGGAIITTTKSGSNDFHFGVNYIWEPDSFAEDRPNTATQGNHLDLRSRNEWNVWASGAIVEDKLFFYGLYNPRKVVQSDTDSGQRNTSVKEDPFYGVKIDFIPFEGHHLEYTYFKDNQSNVTETFDVNNWPSFDAGQNYSVRAGLIGDVTEDDIAGSVGETTNKLGGENSIFKYTGVLTDWFTISAMYGTNEYDRSTGSTKDANPVVIDLRTGVTPVYGDWVSYIVENGNDRREAYRIDADFYFNLAGEHHVRVGWDKEDLNAVNYSNYSGGGLYYRYLTLESSSVDGSGIWDSAVALGAGVGDHYVRERFYQNGGEIQTVQTAMYIQDAWQVSDDLTVNVGLRNETFDNRNADGDTFIKASNQLAARLGFSWTPSDTGRVYGNWGRYYLPIATNTNIRMAASEIFTADWYLLDGLNADDTPIYDTANVLQNVVYGDGEIQDPVSLRDANIKPMYQDEFLLGYEHQFDNGWSVSATAIYRKLGVLIEDIAIDAAVPGWAAANGYQADDLPGADGFLTGGNFGPDGIEDTADDVNYAADNIAGASSTFSGFHQYVLTNPGQDMLVGTNDLNNADGTPAGLVIMDLSADALGYPEGKRTYKAIQLTASREWDGKWSLDANYTFSRSEGNTEGTVKSDNGQDDAGITTDFDQPGLTDYASGRLPNDRTHHFKMWGAYAVTDYLTIGAKLDIESPRQQGCIGVHPTDYFASLYGQNSWFCNGEPTPRGTSQSTDWQKTLDLSFSFTPQFAEQIPGDVTIRADIFNVFNSSAVVDRYEYESNDLFGGPTNFQRPRYVRIMASYKF